VAGLTIRRAETDDDFEAWRCVRIAVLPHERAASVEEMRRMQTPERLLLLAEHDGELVGSGLAGRSDTGGGFVQPRVLAEQRRHGIGTALLEQLLDHLRRLGYDRIGSSVEDPGSLAFAERFGFREVDRQVEQVRTIEPDEPEPSPFPGVELVSLAERPELFERVYHELAVEALRDFAVYPPLEVSFEDWQREWLTWPEGSFVALASGEIVGCAGLLRDEDRPDRAEHGLTAVRRDWRRRGLARTLKQRTIAWAAANGLAELYTWTQTGNEGMRAVNEQLGYATRNVSITVRRTLP
jgi:GNAT superfamily N-acetyltransferase